MITYLTCILEVPVLISVGTPAILTEVFLRFPHFLEENTGRTSKFSSSPSKFIIHYLPALGLCTYSV